MKGLFAKKRGNERLSINLILKWDQQKCDRIKVLSLKYHEKQKYENNCYWVHFGILPNSSFSPRNYFFSLFQLQVHENNSPIKITWI